MAHAHVKVPGNGEERLLVDEEEYTYIGRELGDGRTAQFGHEYSTVGDTEYDEMGFHKRGRWRRR